MKIPGYLPWGLNYPERRLMDRLDDTVILFINQGLLREEVKMPLFQLAFREVLEDMAEQTNVYVVLGGLG